MSLFDRAAGEQVSSHLAAPQDAAPARASTSDAEDSAAHIAELVRRTAERNARPGPSSVHCPGDASAQLLSDRPLPEQHPMPVTPATPRVQEQSTPPKPARRQPSPRILVAAGTAAALLFAGAVAVNGPMSPEVSPPTSSTSAPSDVPSTAKARAEATTAAAARASRASRSARSAQAPAAYAVKVTDVITDCSSHSYGQTESSFDAQNCVKATRSLATGHVKGRPVLFVTSRIEMASVEAAASVKQVLDASGTGNLNDLLREGATFPGAPDTMPDSGYASVQSGAVVMVAEAGFVDDGSSSNTNPALRAAAAQVAGLVSTNS